MVSLLPTGWSFYPQISLYDFENALVPLHLDRCCCCVRQASAIPPTPQLVFVLWLLSYPHWHIRLYNFEIALVLLHLHLASTISLRLLRPILLVFLLVVVVLVLVLVLNLRSGPSGRSNGSAVNLGTTASALIGFTDQAKLSTSRWHFQKTCSSGVKLVVVKFGYQLSLSYSSLFFLICKLKTISGGSSYRCYRWRRCQECQLRSGLLTFSRLLSKIFKMSCTLTELARIVADLLIVCVS